MLATHRARVIAPTLRVALVAVLAAAAGFAAGVFALKSGYFSNPIGVAQLVDGGTYIGEILDGRLEGEGTIQWPGGARYEGEFGDGVMHGQGVYVDNFGTRYEGEFRDGHLSGRARIDYEDGGYYEGGTRAWLMHGEGVYTVGNQAYRGTFVEERFSGEGELLQDGELVYRGEFSDWLYHGRGELVLANGDRYRGRFRFGQYHGSGTMTLAQPSEGVSEYSGIWRDGELVQSDVAAFVENYRRDVERALYREASLLEEALAGLAPGIPGQPDVYFLGIAGDGTQRVFSREAMAFRDYLDRASPLGERQVTLINDRTVIGDRPMATRTSIERALAAIGERMNPEEDVLVLYITSHGSEDHEISLKNPHIGLDDLAAGDLAAMLESSGIRWQVIVVSACYSGGFVDALRSDYNLILTAAASDRTSFGCSDGAELTYFGRALLDSLSQSADPARVYRLLSEAVAARERAEELEPSLPQFYLGPEMEKRLARQEVGLFRETGVPET